MVNHNSERRPADISNSYAEFMSEQELEQALAEAAARHPANVRKTTVPADAPTSEVSQTAIIDIDKLEAEETTINVVHLPLHRLLNDAEPPVHQD